MNLPTETVNLANTCKVSLKLKPKLKWQWSQTMKMKLVCLDGTSGTEVGMVAIRRKSTRSTESAAAAAATATTKRDTVLHLADPPKAANPPLAAHLGARGIRGTNWDKIS
mmetsp:Transcript_30853/g.64476  ORF Transcript_30853/g.64476 Transcript_30853/m.64476 type:complete len:110 (+) Transcript_30853:835-1164(+)